MDDVRIEQISLSNVDNFFQSISNILVLSKDFQLFISNNCLDHLIERNKEYIIWEESVKDSFHYNDRIEMAYLFYVCGNIYQIHLVKKCLNYTKITFFATHGLVYRNYVREMKKIIIIESD